MNARRLVGVLVAVLLVTFGGIAAARAGTRERSAAGPSSGGRIVHAATAGGGVVTLGNPICVTNEDCFDNNPCSDDSCDPSNPGADERGCVYTAANPGAECRPAAGDCDVAEVCDGVSTICPD